MEVRDRILTLQFDGACRPNPGGDCSYGWLVLDGDDVLLSGSERVPLDDPRTNNTAEFWGLFAGLCGLHDGMTLLPPFDALRVEGDSMLVIEGISGRWKMRKLHLAALCTACQCLLKGVPWESRWVRRDFNVRAHELAEEALARSPLPGASRGAPGVDLAVLLR